MKILVIGASGRVGRYLVEYALEKGHDVTAFARNIEELGLQHPNLSTFRGDVLYPALIEAALPGHEAVLSVIGVRRFYGPITLLSTGMANIIAAMHKLGVKRLLTITGAGILQETDDHLIMDSLSFPPNLQNISLDHLRVYEQLKESRLDWTIVSPAFMHHGKRTGTYVIRENFYPKGALNEVSVQDVADFITKEVAENLYLRKRVGIAHPQKT